MPAVAVAVWMGVSGWQKLFLFTYPVSRYPNACCVKIPPKIFIDKKFGDLYPW